jgi:hypothetical protein
MTTPGNYDTDVSDIYAIHRALTGALDAASSYVATADLDTATEKARRDAPAIAVYDLADPGPRPTP